MGGWIAGSGHPMYGIRDWPLDVQELGHLRSRSVMPESVAAAMAEPEMSNELADDNWVHEAAYPEFDLEPVGDSADVKESEFEPVPPMRGVFARVAAAEAVERWLERALVAVAMRIPLRLNLPGELPSACLNSSAELCGLAPAPAAECAAAWVRPADAASPLTTSAKIRLPRLDAAFLAIRPECGNFAALPAPEAVAAWIAAVASFEIAAFTHRTDPAAALRLPALDTSYDLAGTVALPAPETVAAWLTIVSTAEPVAFPHSWDLAHGLAVPALDTTPDLSGPLTAAQPEAAAAWLAPAAHTVPVAYAVGVDLTRGLMRPVLDTTPDPCTESAPLAVQAAAAQQVSTPSPISAQSAPAIPELALSAELDPLSAPEDYIEVPAWCERLMPAPQPEPVWSFLAASRASELMPALPQASPTLFDEILHTHVPLAKQPRVAPQAEPVMSGVWPRVAETLAENIETTPAFQFAERSVLDRPGFALAGAATASAPEAAEVMVLNSESAGPINSHVPLAMPSMAAVAPGEVSRPLALPVAGLPAEVAERLILSAVDGCIPAAHSPALQGFHVTAPLSATVPQGEVPGVAAAASQPSQAEPAAARLSPISTIRLALPEQRQQRPTPAVPRPGLVALEYHTQRNRGVSYARPEWKSVLYQPIPPAFALAAALDNPEDLIKPKEPLKGVFPINKRGPHVSRSVMTHHLMRAAAAVLIVTSMYTLGSVIKNARRATVRPAETAFATPGQVLTPEAQKAVAKKAAESKGPFNWVQQTIANRASVQVADDFQSGMQKWGAAQGQLAPNWRRSKDGYVNTGALALLAPTSKFVDYKLEFYGQIENRGMGWVIRAKDDKNYHAMKLTTIASGLRPLLAMVHYDVVDGKPGRRMETPLNVMVHNNRPFQVAVTVNGKHFTTEVNGEQVDTFREDALPTGGVGFFAEAGEQARLYWTRVTKNDDFLGHVCAFLSGGDSQATAELWPPSVPGGPHGPSAPVNDSVLSAAWIGLPSIRRISSPRRNKRCNR